jgi:integrase
VFQIGGKGNYYYKCTALGITKRCLRTDDEKQAIDKVMADYGHLLGTKDKDKRVKALRQQLAVVKAEPVVKEIPLSKLVEVYLAHTDDDKRQSLSPNTLKVYQYHARMLAEFARSQGLSHIGDITSDTFKAFLKDKAGGRSRGWYNRLHFSIKSIYKVMKKHYGMDDITEGSEYYTPAKVAENRIDRRPFSSEQKAKIIEWMDVQRKIPRYRRDHNQINFFWWVATTLGDETGLRFEDVVHMKKSSLQDNDILYVEEMKTRKTAARHAPRSVAALKEYMATYPTEGDFIFPDYVTQYNRNATSFPTLFRLRLEQIPGLFSPEEQQARRTKRVWFGFHSFRHSKADDMLRQGWGMDEVRNYLGHSKQSITAHYLSKEAVKADKIKQAIRYSTNAELSPAENIFHSIKERLERLGPEEKQHLVSLIETMGT